MEYRAPFEALGIAFVKVEGAVGLAHCVLHRDATPSLNVNLNTGNWHCANCQKSGSADAYENLIMALEVRSSSTIEESVWRGFHEDLLADEQLLGDVKKISGLDDHSIATYRIGWADGRLTLPIFDGKKCVNIRRIALEPRSHIGRVVDYTHEHICPRLFPKGALREHFKQTWVVYDEMDAILLIQQGISAVTVAGDIRRWKHSWTQQFSGRNIVICMGNGAIGDVAAEKLAIELAPVAAEVRKVRLTLPSGKDTIRGAVVDCHWNTGDFMAMSQKFDPLPSPNIPGKESRIPDSAIEVDLTRASQGDLVGKRVKTRVVVAGKDLAPYSVPKEVILTCPGGLKVCASCPIAVKDGRLDLTLDCEDPVLLKMLGVNAKEQHKVMAQRAGTPNECPRFVETVRSYHNLEEVKLIPDLDSADAGGEYTIRNAYYVGDGTRTNQSYEAEGKVLPHPQTQHVTFLLPKMKPVQASFLSYRVDNAAKERLSKFQVSEGQTVLGKLDDIAKQLEQHVTKFHMRRDLIIGFDVVAHSILQFRFQEQMLTRGWVEGLFAGDTRCAKSQTAEKLVRHYRMGEFLTAENITYAGLVGGLQQTQKHWSITWGKWPLNDGRMIVLDECSGLTEEEISRMSGLRSSGIAEITKIQYARTLARARALWISNPRSKRPVDTYGSGSELIRELIGRPEDIARFDFAQLVSTRDVPAEITNGEPPVAEGALVYDSDLCRELVLWAWSRKPDQVSFDPEATNACLKAAIELAKNYGGDLPLVEPNEQRVKVARMAVAIAARLFSTDDGEIVRVKKEHVEAVVTLLSKWYDHPSFDYKASTEMRRRDLEIPKAMAESLAARISNLPNGTVEQLLYAQFVTLNDLMDLTGLDLQAARSLLSHMVRAGALHKRMSGYVKTPGFIALLKREREDSKAMFTEEGL